MSKVTGIILSACLVVALVLAAVGWWEYVKERAYLSEERSLYRGCMGLTGLEINLRNGNPRVLLALERYHRAAERGDDPLTAVFELARALNEAIEPELMAAAASRPASEPAAGH